MSTTKKVWLGISTFAPILSFAIIFMSYFVMFASVANRVGEYPAAPPVAPMLGSVLGIMFAYLILFAAMIINVIIYVGHIVRNLKLDNSSKTMWICLMFFFSFIVMIVYYFMYIVSERPPVQEPPAPTLSA